MHYTEDQPHTEAPRHWMWFSNAGVVAPSSSCIQGVALCLGWFLKCPRLGGWHAFSRSLCAMWQDFLCYSLITNFFGRLPVCLLSRFIITWSHLITCQLFIYMSAWLSEQQCVHTVKLQTSEWCPVSWLLEKLLPVLYQGDVEYEQTA